MMELSKLNNTSTICPKQSPLLLPWKKYKITWKKIQKIVNPCVLKETTTINPRPRIPNTLIITHVTLLLQVSSFNVLAYP